MNLIWQQYLNNIHTHLQNNESDESQPNFMADLPSYGLIRIQGESAEKFLQGQFTCDVSEVNLQQSRLGAYCDSAGRVFATFRLFHYQGDYYLSLPLDNIAATLQRLQKYAVFSKVTLTDVSAEWVSIVCVGDNIPNLLTQIFSNVPDNIDQVYSDNNLIILKTLANPIGWQIIGKPAAIIKVWQTLQNHLALGNTRAWQLLTIRAGVPEISFITAGLFTPHMLNYPQLNAVSFKKGCYVGQEIIARTQYLGKAKRHLYYAINNSLAELSSGDKLYNSEHKEIGIVVNSCLNKNNSCELLAVLQDDAIKQEVFWQDQKLRSLLSLAKP